MAPFLGSTNRLTRRQLLTVSAAGAVNLFPLTRETGVNERLGKPFLKELGFWDYTTPGAGGMEAFQKRELPVGPPVDMKIAREDLIQQMESSGFRFVQEQTFLPYQYFLVFMVR